MNSGFNLSESIIGDNFVESGDANVAVNLVNFSNTNLNGDADFLIENFDIYDQQIDDLVVDFESSDATRLELTGEDNSFEEMDLGASNQVLAGNENTQSDSFNVATARQVVETNIQNTNEAALDQDLEININTGGNVTEGNTGTTAIGTGDINLAVNVFNFLNANLNNVANLMIGTVNVFGEMLGDIVLAEPIPSDTTTTETSPNETELTAGNSNTGSGSVNITASNSETLTQIINNNELTVDNTIGTNLGTGANEISSVNGAVTLQTGQVEESINTKTVGNVNSTGSDDEVFWLIVMNNLGEWTGDILGYENENFAQVAGFGLFDQEDVKVKSSNENTLGDINIAESEYEEITTITNNNTAEIESNLTINATTGGNLINSNNGPANIETGDIKTGVNLINFANFNFTGKTVFVAVVNVFGKFLGDILPPGWVGIPELDEHSPLANNTEPENNSLAEKIPDDLEKAEEENSKVMPQAQNDLPDTAYSEPKPPIKDFDSPENVNDSQNDHSETSVGSPYQNPTTNNPPQENTTSGETDSSDPLVELEPEKPPEPNLPDKQTDLSSGEPSSTDTSPIDPEPPPDFLQEMGSILASQFDTSGIPSPEQDKNVVNSQDVEAETPAKYVFASTHSDGSENDEDSSMSWTTLITLLILVSLAWVSKRHLKFILKN